jgi:hypothetical protein
VPDARRRRFFVVAAACLLVGLVVVGAIARARQAPFAGLDGVRLGMTVRDVRVRFDAVGPGHWESRVGDDVVLTWKPAPETHTGPIAATFEFHLGILMAIRAELPPGEPAAKGAPFELSDSTVVVREPQPVGTVHLTAIARSCPVHANEARSLIESRRP